LNSGNIQFQHLPELDDIFFAGMQRENPIFMKW
jgi:hypothetical protein